MIATLTSRLTESVRRKRQSSRELYYQLLARADKPKSGDDEKLNAVLLELNLTPADAERDSLILRELAALEAQAAKQEQLTKPWQDAKRARAEFAAETARLIAERSKTAVELEAAEHKAQHAVQQCCDAREKARRVRQEHADLVAMASGEPASLPA